MNPSPEMPSLLTPDESKQLKFCEETIRKSINAFMDVGAALLTIRDKKLYRTKFSTFEKYCLTAFGFSDRRARQYMDAFETMNGISADASKTGTIVPLPENEAQVRELAKAPPEQRLEILKEASAGSPDNKPTAKQIAEVVAKKAGQQAIRQFSEMSALERIANSIEKTATAFTTNEGRESLAETLELLAASVREKIDPEWTKARKAKQDELASSLTFRQVSTSWRKNNLRMEQKAA